MNRRRVAVMGDIHGNARALRSAINKARAENCNEFILLGDLLTYGVNVNSVLAEVNNLCKTNKTHLLRGNHDVIYSCEYLKGCGHYEMRLPAWIRESIAYTRSKISMDVFNELPFLSGCVIDGIYYSHANPFEIGNWSYLNSIQDVEEAFKALKNMGVYAGIFGHTHRPRLYSYSCGEVYRHDLPIAPFELLGDVSYCINAGSIGQPRDKEKNFCFPIIDYGNTLSLRFVDFEYDVSGFISEIECSPLSLETKHELLKFF